MPSDPIPPSDPFPVRSHFLPARNALAVDAYLGPLYIDYYLHLMRYQIRPDPAHDQFLKDTLAALALHLTTRPREEATAWTINLHDPPLNVFATGDCISGTLTGRVFTDHIRTGSSDLFYSQVTRPGQQTRQSMVKVHDSSDALRTVEHFYDQSEQLPARFFRLPDEHFLLVAAMPDCDEAWLASLSLDDATNIAQSETLDLMEIRHLRFGCGCTIDRILPAIEGIARGGIDALFAGDHHLSITCPRCAANYNITRDDFEAWLGTR